MKKTEKFKFVRDIDNNNNSLLSLNEEYDLNKLCTYFEMNRNIIIGRGNNKNTKENFKRKINNRNYIKSHCNNYLLLFNLIELLHIL